MECKLRCVNFRRVSDPWRAFLPAFRVTGSTGNKPDSADNKPGSIWERRGQTWDHRREVWEHLKSQQSSMGKTTSASATRQVSLEIIATTYRSTICKTHVFSLYSHLCINIVTHLHTVYLNCLPAVLESNSRGA